MTAVEFAVVAPVILLLFLSAIEVTRLNFLRHTAANAAYEAARHAIIPGSTASDADAAALQLLAAVQADRGVEIDVEQTLERVSVTVTIPVNLNSWGVSRFTSGYTIVQSCTLSRETNR
ncbi:TadE family protein [Candidatus Laterigemmans baculatus]|uniref:TadE family protein n=1 Tax=Candidatus Laterigemmans baculatus TaxID=2770505 RepID=UPI00193B5EB3|nr:TadE family protein [Candidatus Laterigemmans baculatus]